MDDDECVEPEWFGEYLRRWRRGNRLSVEGAAQRAGISRSYWARLESGQEADVPWEIANRIELSITGKNRDRRSEASEWARRREHVAQEDLGAYDLTRPTFYENCRAYRRPRSWTLIHPEHNPLRPGWARLRADLTG